jgi:hypothetical protein
MDFVYLLMYENEWEDIVVILSKDDAIKASIDRPNARVEIFSKTTSFGYTPTYNYYKNGEYIQNK